MRGMGNIPQMMMQGMMQGMSPMQNPMVQEIIRMRQQGMDPAAAFQQLSQRYPQFRQAAPFLGGKTPQQMDQTAQNALQQSGVDPNAMAQQFQRFF
ncbi:hypothetical protein [Flintibacter muris]|uniref:hypothetical protein n=1 Tax=Flintibacter muris TaxID=2941327 RepID=UPI00203E38A6|nr:hypothetical protein [Flintibacter muris]